MPPVGLLGQPPINKAIVIPGTPYLNNIDFSLGDYRIMYGIPGIPRLTLILPTPPVIFAVAFIIHSY